MLYKLTKISYVILIFYILVYQILFGVIRHANLIIGGLLLALVIIQMAFNKEDIRILFDFSSALILVFLIFSFISGIFVARNLPSFISSISTLFHTYL